MATRKQAGDTRWLAGWKDIPGTDTQALDPLEDNMSLHDNLRCLTQLGYIVRISGVIGNYQVQCIAIRDTPYRLKEPIGLSYCGASLCDVLSAACYEADIIALSPEKAEYRIGERARWVQS